MKPEAARVLVDLMVAMRRIERLGLGDSPKVARAIDRAERELERAKRPQRPS